MPTIEQLCFLVACDAVSMEDAILVLLKRQAPPRAVTLGERFNIEAIGNQECRLYFRFRKCNVLKLLELSGLESQYWLPNRVSFSGVEGVCVLLRRMAYPGRFCDLSFFFGRHPSVLCAIFGFMVQYFYNRFKSLLSLDAGLIDLNRLQIYSSSIRNRGAALSNCIGFVDGTLRGIQALQKCVCNGHKRKHGLKYQGVIAPDGMFIDFFGPIPGRRHDIYLLHESKLLQKMDKLLVADGSEFCIYGDPTYINRRTLVVGFKGNNLTAAQKEFYASMSKV
ncbi:hypothetical protein Ae201684P_018794 [Aphanomyces euteiches]|uniref:DDE Tnp4 domain-containing protein n=1 Tax=Aphanomyces euteiches TaxID=100861 RepID=A0A6G0XUN1_9STRA|nr:hypothetical protein Ae201684_001309 [Aphanomyces euteiches]KAH9099784.1 hypothetical protein Ae201684P_018794 [Aphanomyces euteiches]